MMKFSKIIEPKGYRVNLEGPTSNKNFREQEKRLVEYPFKC